jgi:hypothetical protein
LRASVRRHRSRLTRVGFGRSDRSRIGQQVGGHAGYKTCCPDLSQSEGPSAFVPEGFLVTQTSVVSSRQRSQGGLVHLVNGCRGDAEFGGDHSTACWPTLRSTRPSEVVEARLRCAPMSDARPFAAIPRLISSHRNHVATYRPSAHGSDHPPMTGPLHQTHPGSPVSPRSVAQGQGSAASHGAS